METSFSGLDISQPRVTVTEGFINPIEGSSTPFLSIPSPIDLLAWNSQLQATKAIQGGEGLCAGFQDEPFFITVELHNDHGGPNIWHNLPECSQACV